MTQGNPKFSKVKNLRQELFAQLKYFNVSNHDDLSARLYNCAHMPGILPTQIEHVYKTTFSGQAQDIIFCETDFTKINGLPSGYLNIKVFNNLPAFEFLGGWTTKSYFHPVFVVVYLDEIRNVKLYIPKKGNPINPITNQAYPSHLLNGSNTYPYNIDHMRLDICDYFNLTKEWMYPE